VNDKNIEQSYRYGFSWLNVSFWLVFWAFCINLDARAESKKFFLNKIHNQLTENKAIALRSIASTSARDLLAQQEVTKVTGVEAKQTDRGLELILKTVAGSKRLVPLILPKGNDLVIEITDATLAFAIRNGVEEINPAEGINKITVNKVDDSSIRVRITGEKQAPNAEVIPSLQNLVLSVTTDGTTTTQTPDEEIEIIATGEAEEERYNPSNASTATRTDTPLRDVPQSIQIIPQKVIEDQGITRIGDALRNVSGVTPQRDFANISDRFSIRGFDRSRTLRNGFTSGTDLGSLVITAPNVVERIEVLKGPASVLYGQVQPGGVVNYVTKKPLDEPFYNLEFTAGSFGFIEPAIDFSGLLTEDKKLTYRFNLSYQNAGNFRDFVDSEILVVAPTISYKFSDDTSLTFEYEYLDSNLTFDDGLPIDPVIFDLPRERFLGEPDDFIDTKTHSFYLNLDHRFNDNIRLRSGFAAQIADNSFSAFRTPEFAPETGEVSRGFSSGDGLGDTLAWQTDLISTFKTGSIKHQLLAGFELARNTSENNLSDFFDLEADIALPINVFNPQYDTPIPDSRNNFLNTKDTLNTLGFYLQDQVTLLSNLKLLVGGRYDFVNSKSDFFQEFAGEISSSSDEFDREAFSPRVGLVYQPIEPISLYASYSRSFIPNTATTSDGEVIEPERGTQYEVGVKGEFGDFSTTLATYEITKTNIARTDPENPDFSIPVGEVKSRGIELDVAGEPISGWNIIASLFFNDAFISVGDEFNPEDDTLINAPGSGASLWTSYEIQKGKFKGFGFGGGLFYVADVEAEIPNDFVLPSYVRADASLFYDRDNWRVQLNFKNLFDKEYFESAESTAVIFPGAPFSVLGSVSVEF
jgi:iron complex outermembrane recepter protein